jgi:MFS family permease
LHKIWNGGKKMANKSFLGALWSGDIVGAAGALVAGIMHMLVMGAFLLLLGLTTPILAVAMPFVAYRLSPDDIGIFVFFYFFLGAFAAGMFTGMVYILVTRKERRERGETFAEHCRNVAGWPTLSLFASLVASFIFHLMFQDLLWSESNTAHAMFFALAPVAVFAPLWAFLIHRRCQKTAMIRDKAARKAQSDADRARLDAEWESLKPEDRRMITREQWQRITAEDRLNPEVWSEVLERMPDGWLLPSNLTPEECAEAWDRRAHLLRRYEDAKFLRSHGIVS